MLLSVKSCKRLTAFFYYNKLIQFFIISYNNVSQFYELAQ